MIAPVQYAHVPPAHLLGGPSVRCARCHVVLRPGQERAVQIEPSGAVRCVVCPVSRVASEGSPPMNIKQEIEAAAVVLSEANATAVADALGAWEPYFAAKHRDTAIAVWTFGLLVGRIYVAIVGPSSGGRWSWHVSYGGPKGHAATAAEALAAAREAAQPEARKWTRMAS